VASEGGTKIDRALRSAARLAAGLTGVTTAVVTRDPYAGAVTGWATNELLTIGREVMERVTERAAVRVGASRLIIEADLQEREHQGHVPRSDGFFDERGVLRPEAHELLESVLLASANSFEERKLPYLAHMYDGVAYDSTVSAGDSLFLAHMADQLTFRQLQGLAVFGRHGTGDTALEIELGQIEAEHRSGATVVDPAMFEELKDLGSRRLVGAWTGDGQVRDPSTTWGGDWEGVSIGQVALTELGKLLHRLMRLDDMPAVEWRSWIDAYRGQAR
jgi:hypothetical protein